MGEGKDGLRPDMIARSDGQPDSMSGCARWLDADADDDHIDIYLGQY